MAWHGVAWYGSPDGCTSCSTVEGAARRVDGLGVPTCDVQYPRHQQQLAMLLSATLMVLLDGGSGHASRTHGHWGQPPTANRRRRRRRQVRMHLIRANRWGRVAECSNSCARNRASKPNQTIHAIPCTHAIPPPSINHHPTPL
ncbi:hypothetical protein VFPFJ_09386 [Purpureocillium lilacinum]|uniref:Uncharacterized protein n=1 Tax=Purpureocillium lilacinum TaxID=33203 RepID=A0A179GUF8_PURLI|nr:hypothetical protein VFPFJ_09386 [Purpureocillium lilacinum]OAQ80933.1 hypothetical protein VFPFJ_09386 [Purpureocillium lilacinum]